MSMLETAVGFPFFSQEVDSNSSPLSLCFSTRANKRTAPTEALKPPSLASKYLLGCFACVHVSAGAWRSVGAKRDAPSGWFATPALFLLAHTKGYAR